MQYYHRHPPTSEVGERAKDTRIDSILLESRKLRYCGSLQGNVFEYLVPSGTVWEVTEPLGGRAMPEEMSLEVGFEDL